MTDVSHSPKPPQGARRPLPVSYTHLDVYKRQVMGLAIRTEVDEENARIRLELPNSLEEAEETQAQNALNALMLYFINLKARYQDFIEVMEV